MVTILDALQKACKPFKSEANAGTNTSFASRIEITSWEEWEDFTYENITSKFVTELATEYNGPTVGAGEVEPKPLDKDLVIHNENALEVAQRLYRTSIVNYALESLGSDANPPHYGIGTRCSNGGKEPDWSCVSDDHLDEDEKYLNLVPGETKLSAKWVPDWVDSGRGINERSQWRVVMGQQATYMVLNNARYGFIVTDDVLVVLRIRKTSSGPEDSDEEDADEDDSEAENASDEEDENDPNYEDSGDDPEDEDYIIEHQVISWEKHGDVLTAKLALWALAMLSKDGDSHIHSSYPGLNGDEDDDDEDDDDDDDEDDDDEDDDDDEEEDSGEEDDRPHFSRENSRDEDVMPGPTKGTSKKAKKPSPGSKGPPTEKKTVRKPASGVTGKKPIKKTANEPSPDGSKAKPKIAAESKPKKKIEKEDSAPGAAKGKPKRTTTDTKPKRNSAEKPAAKPAAEASKATPRNTAAQASPSKKKGKKP